MDGDKIAGATPYDDIPNLEIADKVHKGVRPKKLQYVGDFLYQVMLNCWQLDKDERPNFEEVVSSLQDIKEDRYTPSLSLKNYNNFQFEIYHEELEITKV